MNHDCSRKINRLNWVHTLEDKSLISLNNKGIFGYVHNTKEIIQQLKVCRGDLKIPRELKQYITHKNLPEGDGEIQHVLNNFDATHIFIMEISSLRVVSYKGYSELAPI